MHKVKFVSYAQNYEDLIIWHALGNIEDGYYIDVGAGDPIDISVTKSLYDMGWSGINIEPIESLCDDLKKNRKRDLCLNIGVSDREGVLPLYIVGGGGSMDMEYVSKCPSCFETINIPVVPLGLVINEYAQDVENIHLLKIDVDGHEEMVLRGIDLNSIRPWIICIEITIREDWETLLIDQNYILAYKDSINSYYVAYEKIDVCERFRASEDLLEIYNIYKIYMPKKDFLLPVNSRMHKIYSFTRSSNILYKIARLFLR